MLFDNLKTRTDQGNLGETRAIYEFTKHGFAVSKPLTNNNKYDLIVDKDGILSKVSVKTSGRKKPNGSYEVYIATSGGNTTVNKLIKRQDKDYDLLFVLLETDEWYIIPSTALGSAGVTVIVTSSKYDKFKYNALAAEMVVLQRSVKPFPLG